MACHWRTFVTQSLQLMEGIFRDDMLADDASSPPTLARTYSVHETHETLDVSEQEVVQEVPEQIQEVPEQIQEVPEQNAFGLTRMGRPMRHAATKVAARISSILSWENASENSSIVRETADIIDMEIALDHKRKKRRTMVLGCIPQAAQCEDDSEDDAGADDTDSIEEAPSIPDEDSGDSEFTTNDLDEDQEEDEAEDAHDSDEDDEESDEEGTDEAQEEFDEDSDTENPDMDESDENVSVDGGPYGESEGMYQTDNVNVDTSEGENKADTYTDMFNDMING
jgi:hypothetical protein